MELSEFLMTIGFLFLGGLATDLLGRRTALPRVSLLILFGIAIGPAGFDVLPDGKAEWFPVVADMALVLVGFLIGGSLSRHELRHRGVEIVAVSLGKVIGSFVVVSAGFALIGLPIEAALVLGGVSSATDPAATAEVLRELRANGPFSKALMGIVAIDDAWGLILFSFVIATTGSIVGIDGVDSITHGVHDLVGAVLLGVGLGIPAAALTGRIQPGEPTQAEALGVAFLCGGLALWLEVSLILAAMVLGATIANFAKHHQYPFRAIEGIEWPFMILFFVLAGASFEAAGFARVWPIVLAYVVLRALGSMGGTWASARWVGASPDVQRWMGLALLPQAGVALGMALVASQHFPWLVEDVMTTVVVSTALLELLGPILTRIAVTKAGEVPDDSESSA